MNKENYKHNPSIKCDFCGRHTVEVWNQELGFYCAETESYIVTDTLTHARCMNCSYGDTM